MKKCIVFGGAGFLGSSLVHELARLPQVEQITVFDNLSTGRVENLPRDCPKVDFFRGEIGSQETVALIMRGHDTIFHFAANADIAKAETEPMLDFWQGTCLTANILEAMRTIAGHAALFYASGSGVYGDKPTVRLAEDYGPMRPISPYGASKLACEAMICSYCAMFGLTARAFRFANIVGPRQTHGVGFDFIRRLQHDSGRLRMLGDGTQTKGYLHVSDAISAMLLVGAGAETGYDVFNVAPDDLLSVREVAELAISAMDLGKNSVRLEPTGGSRGWRGDVPVVEFNCHKIKATGWRPVYSSAQAMAESLEAMRKELCTL